MEIASGARLGRYEIRSKIGEGGMGEVYLAEDTKLDRKVALKILRREVGDDLSRMNRFVQEAKAASALNHPNIITIHEIDEKDSGHFIATEFIDGETVRERLRKAPLSVSEALNIAAQVAAALTAAHQAGIIHRDIKPENVMVRQDGFVKVLDFGLAKLTTSGPSDPEGATRISDTQPGMIMGTVAYMSPEQVRGKAVDARTDVWSLGVLLYEMLSGRTPFRGETASDTLANILHREPDALNIGTVPDDLARIIETMLAKEMESRYRTIADVASDLKKLQRRIEFDSEMQQTSLRGAPLETESKVTATTSLPETAHKSVDSAAARSDEGFWVAVLPFKYRGSSAELEELAEGLTEDMVTGLSRFSYLRVIARSSTLRYANESGDIRAIGRELGARYVLEGSLRQAGGKVRLAVQLIDATNGAQLWAETYERTFRPDSVFDLQDELVPPIVSTIADLHGVLPRSMGEAVRGKAIAQLTPYEALLRSFRYSERITAEVLVDARAALEVAVQKAPAYADAWAMLASLYTQDYAQGFNLFPDSLTQAEAAGRKAVELAPSNHLAWFGLAGVHFFQKELQSFRNAVERAVTLNPMDGNSLANLGELLTFAGDFERGLELSQRAKQLNPHHPGWYWYANFYQAFSLNDYRAALGFARKVNLPGHWAEPMLTAAAAGLLGERESATKAVTELLKLRPDVGATVRRDMGKWWSAAVVDRLIDGLRKAGLEVTDDPTSPPPPSRNTTAI